MIQPTIIDFHTHAFPDSLAPRAIAQLTINAAASGYTPLTDGTVGGLIASMDNAGITKSVICNIATNARQMTKVNDFAISCTRNPRLIPLGSLHPDADGAAISVSAPITTIPVVAKPIKLLSNLHKNPCKFHHLMLYYK